MKIEKVHTLQEAQDYLMRYFPTDRSYAFSGDKGLKRQRQLLQLLDSPQNKVNVVHIAGTSGKGSTAFYVSQLLMSQGKKTGLFLSPHLIDVRERFEVNNQLLDEAPFCNYLNQIQNAVEKMESSPLGRPTYFEVSVALAFYIFWKEKVDYAVMETGLGGLYDGTNVVDSASKVAVITRIGHDHMDILGKTLSQIAEQKAGIIQDKNVVITIQQHRHVARVLAKSTQNKRGKLIVVKKNDTYHSKGLRNDSIYFDFSFMNTAFKNLQLHSPAEFQVENSSLALATVLYLAERDGFQLDELQLRNILRSVQFAGRMELLKHGTKTVILDGAHNPQKMSAFITSLKKEFPDRKFCLLISVKKGKNYPAMFKYITPLVDNLIVTQFSSVKQGMQIGSESSEKIKSYFQRNGVKKISVENNPEKAYRTALSETKDVLVVTGSLYLLSEIYKLAKKG